MARPPADRSTPHANAGAGAPPPAAGERIDPEVRGTLVPPHADVDIADPVDAGLPVQPSAADAPPVAAQLDPTEKASITQADGAPPPADVKKVVRKAGIGTLPMALLRRFVDSDVIGQAAALAFYGALSLGPLLLLLLWLTASSPQAQAAVITQVGMLAGAESQAVARTVLAQAAAAPDTGSIAGWWSISLLLVGASAVFAQLQQALNRIFRTDATALPGLWNWLKKRLLSFGLVLAVVFLLVVSMTLTTVLDLTFGRFAQGETVAATLAALLVYAVTFALMYHYLPDRRVRWRLALAGGSLTAVLFLAGRAAIAWYLARQSTSSAYGAMGALVLAMLWVYYAAMILFGGAVVTATIDERLGPAPETG